MEVPVRSTKDFRELREYLDQLSEHGSVGAVQTDNQVRTLKQVCEEVCGEYEALEALRKRNENFVGGKEQQEKFQKALDAVTSNLQTLMKYTNDRFRELRKPLGGKDWEPLSGPIIRTEDNVSGLREDVRTLAETASEVKATVDGVRAHVGEDGDAEPLHAQLTRINTKVDGLQEQLKGVFQGLGIAAKAFRVPIGSDGKSEPLHAVVTRTEGKVDGLQKVTEKQIEDAFAKLKEVLDNLPSTDIPEQTLRSFEKSMADGLEAVKSQLPAIVKDVSHMFQSEAQRQTDARRGLRKYLDGQQQALSDAVVELSSRVADPVPLNNILKAIEHARVLVSGQVNRLEETNADVMNWRFERIEDSVPSATELHERFDRLEDCVHNATELHERFNGLEQTAANAAEVDGRMDQLDAGIAQAKEAIDIGGRRLQTAVVDVGSKTQEGFRVVEEMLGKTGNRAVEHIDLRARDTVEAIEGSMGSGFDRLMTEAASTRDAANASAAEARSAFSAANTSACMLNAVLGQYSARGIQVAQKTARRLDGYHDEARQSQVRTLHGIAGLTQVVNDMRESATALETSVRGSQGQLKQEVQGNLKKATDVVDKGLEEMRRVADVLRQSQVGQEAALVEKLNNAAALVTEAVGAMRESMDGLLASVRETQDRILSGVVDGLGQETNAISEALTAAFDEARHDAEQTEQRLGELIVDGRDQVLESGKQAIETVFQEMGTKQQELDRLIQRHSSSMGVDQLTRAVNERFEELSASLQDVHASKDELQAQNVRLLEQVRELTRQNGELSNLNRDVPHLRNDLAVERTRGDREGDLRVQAEKRLADSRDRVGRLETVEADLRLQVQNLLAELQATRDELDDADGQRRDDQARREDLQRRLVDSTQRVGTLEGIEHELRHQVQNLVTAGDDALRQRLTDKEARGRLDQNLADSRARVETLEEVERGLRTRIRDLETERDGARRQRVLDQEEHRQDLEASHREADSLAEDLDLVRHEAADLAADLGAARQEADDVAADLDAVRQEAGGLAKHLDHAEQRLEVSIERMETMQDRVHALEKQRTAQRCSLRQAREAEACLQRERDGLQEGSSAMEAQIADLQAQLRERDSALQGARQDNEVLQLRLDSVNERLPQLEEQVRDATWRAIGLPTPGSRRTTR